MIWIEFKNLKLHAWSMCSLKVEKFVQWGRVEHPPHLLLIIFWMLNFFHTLKFFSCLKFFQGLENDQGRHLEAYLHKIRKVVLNAQKLTFSNRKLFPHSFLSLNIHLWSNLIQGSASIVKIETIKIVSECWLNWNSQIQRRSQGG